MQRAMASITPSVGRVVALLSRYASKGRLLCQTGNWELFRELQNLDGLKTMTYLLNSEKKSEAIRSFESDQDRALALVKHFVELDNHVNNKD